MGGGTVIDLGLTIPDWEDHASCAWVENPEIFFSEAPGAGAARDIRAAKKVCHDCPVRAQCLDYALTCERSPDFPGGPHGVWGGLDHHERRQLLRGAS